MSADRVRDGVRIAQLLASELESGATPDALAVTDADPEVEPTAEGALAYRVRAGGDDIATVFVQPERARVEFSVAPAAVAEAAEEAGLRVRPKAAQPPGTIVFVEDGAQVKHVLPAFAATLGDDR